LLAQRTRNMMFDNRDAKTVGHSTPEDLRPHDGRKPVVGAGEGGDKGPGVRR
jgi:hypothetical protein